MKCPNCAAESSGSFCPECGTPLKGAACRSCNAALAAGANYCTSCGAPARAGARRTHPAWYVAGAALVVLIVVLVWPSAPAERTPESDGRVPISQMQDAAPLGGSDGTPPQLTGTPREQADRLFNRVMTEQANGDTTQARFFLPMALQAYDMAGELDADGLYHLALLQTLTRDYDAARRTAERILSGAPDHLLALSAAGNAAHEAGDRAAAQSYYRRFVAAYAKEKGRTDLPEYRDHGRVFAELKAEAESRL